MPSKQRSKSTANRAPTRSEQTASARASTAPVNQAASYGVRTVDAAVPEGATYWRVSSVRHLSPDENRGKHHVYVDALDEAGQRDHNPALRITWTWEGRGSHEPAPPVALDK